MPDGDAPLPEPTEPARRRLEAPPDPSKAGRTGCMAWGAVLGVIFGIMLGLYALPPILKSIYGVDEVALGDTWEDDGRTMRVLSVTELDRSPAGAVAVQVEVVAAERWELAGEDFELELADGERLDLVDVPAGGFAFEPDAPAGVTLTFPRLPGQEAEPTYLHLSGPRVRFDLLPAED